MHLDIDGIDVIFPFDFIYPEQISYMRELKYRSGIFECFIDFEILSLPIYSRAQCPERRGVLVRFWLSEIDMILPHTHFLDWSIIF